jgi:hypothetical protein
MISILSRSRVMERVEGRREERREERDGDMMLALMKRRE